MDCWAICCRPGCDFRRISRPDGEAKSWHSCSGYHAGQGMSLEIYRNVVSGCTDYVVRSDPARACVRARGSSRANHGRHPMNLLPGLKLVLEELTQRFGEQIEKASACQPNELYLHTDVQLASALCSAFYKKYGGRLAGVFAEDARAEQKV